MRVRSGNQLPRGYGMVKFLWLTWYYKMQIHLIDINVFLYRKMLEVLIFLSRDGYY
jgi:hypothetical protein